MLSQWKKVRRLEKGTLPPVVAVATNMRYAEKEDDVMDLEEEEEMAIRFRRNSCIHGARRKSLDGLCKSHLTF